MTDKSRAPKAQQMRKLFQDNTFTINVVEIEMPEINVPANMTRPAAADVYRFRTILEYSRERKDSHMIIIKDSVKTKLNGETIGEIMRSIVDEADYADITYLSTTQPQGSGLIKRKITSELDLIRGVKESSTSALLLSAKGRDMLLGETKMANGKLFMLNEADLSNNINNAIESKGITADVLIPSIFETADYSAIIPIISNNESSNMTYENIRGFRGMSPILVIIIVIIVLALLWLVYYYFMRK